MPLYKKKPFSLLENPADLSPDELVFQIRYTNEIFRDYGEYLNRINLYRQRVWSCKVTGKSNLSFEEALLSERDAIAKVQQFPSELIAPVLEEVQFSMLNLKDLINKIVAKVQNCILVGSESYGRKNNRTYPCKIIKVLREEADKTQYQVAWLDQENKVTSNAVVDGDDLIKKKLPFSRDVLKSFIRESTYRSLPWMLLEKLAKKHKISTKPPKEVVAILSVQNGHANKKRKRKDENNPDNLERSKQTLVDCKRKRCATEVDKKHIEPKYPIDDLVVHPSAEDSNLTKCPSPSSNFIIPMDCVGDCLMVWDFCSSFGRLLMLSPFSFEDFQNALCHKDSSVDLIIETHSALLRLLIKDSGEYLLATQGKKRKQKITFINWVEYLCDFLEMVGTVEFSDYVSTIKRGHYGSLDIGAKLGMLRELVTRVLATQLYREKLDEYIQERQALAATEREESLAEGRKKRKDKVSEVLSNGMQASEGHKVGFNGSNSIEVATYGDNQQIGTTNHSEPALNESKKEDPKIENDASQTKVDGEVVVGSTTHSSKKGVQKVVSGENEGVDGEKSLKQRKEYLKRKVEKSIIQTNPLGKDRNYSRYWVFRNDPRIYVESSDSTRWGYYSSKDELDSFIGSLNCKGIRERALKKELEHYYEKICSGLQKMQKDRAVEEADVRRSTRIRALPRENPAFAFLKYVNKWGED